MLNLFGKTMTVPAGNFLDFIESIPSYMLEYILTLISAFAVIATILIIILRKRKSIILEQKAIVEEAEKSCRDLEKQNRELLEQKNVIARELANSEMLYSIILDSADDGVVFYNMDWTVKFLNPAMYSMIGLETQAAESVDILTDKRYLHSDDQGFHTERARAIKENDFYESEIRLRHKNGNYIVLSTKLVKVSDESGSALGILSISRDITSLKATQDQLIVAKEKAEESNRLKSTFLANISHEIRTPLNSIVGFANLLEDVSSSPEMRDEYVGYLNQNTEKLLQIITDIIDLSRLENNEIDIRYQPVKINSILDYAGEYAENLIRSSGKNIVFSLDKGLPDGKDIVYTDALWLKRVFRHLTDNAVKFTREGSVELCSVLAGSSLMFTIKDTGIGISSESMKAIFEQFRQEENGHHRSFEGLGIGLTMARKVVENMDGFLWVESVKGEGSEFFFTIPYRPVDASAFEVRKEELIEPVTDHDWTGKTIVVADDNIDILRFLNHVLTETGINVIQARSGVETIELIKKAKSVDMVLLDMQMPEMNGMEAMLEIRKLKGDIPIIAQTAFIFEEEQDDLISAGCDACLLKPVSQDQLLSVISGFMKRNGSGQIV